MLPLLALRAAKLVSRSRNVGSSSGESSSLVNGSYGPPKPTPKNMAQRMKRAVDRVFSKGIQTVPVPSRAVLITLMDQASHGLTFGIMWGSYVKVSIKVALTWHSVVSL